jgi:hypothetical protein
MLEEAVSTTPIGTSTDLLRKSSIFMCHDLFDCLYYVLLLPLNQARQKNKTGGNMTRQEEMVRKQEDLQELEIDGITFVREQDNDYGPCWKVFESGSWQEWQRKADEYGTVENNGDDFVFTPNIGCAYPLFPEVLHVIATFIKQDEPDDPNHKLTMDSSEIARQTVENNDDISLEDLFGPGKPLSKEELARRAAEQEQWDAELERIGRAESLLTLVVDEGTAREKALIVLHPDRTPPGLWHRLVSGIGAAGNVSGTYPLADGLTDEYLDERAREWAERFDKAYHFPERNGEDSYWLGEELDTVVAVVDAIEEYGRERLFLQYISDWGEQHYRAKEELKALGLISDWEARNEF